MADENVVDPSAEAEAPAGDDVAEEVTPDEAGAEPETTDAPGGVADVENLPVEDVPEGDVPGSGDAEPEASAEPEPAGEAEPAVEPEPAVEAEPAAEEAPAEEPAPAAVSLPKPKKKRLPRALRPQKTRPTHVPSSERKSITRLPKPEHERGRRQERQGKVVSASADKTIVVRVDVAKAHPMYKKVIRRSSKLHAHDEENQAKVGDIVRIVETRPLSKLKRWRLQEVVEAAK